MKQIGKRSLRFKRKQITPPVVPGAFNIKEFHIENEATSTFYTRCESKSNIFKFLTDTNMLNVYFCLASHMQEMSYNYDEDSSPRCLNSPSVRTFLKLCIYLNKCLEVKI